MIRMSEQVEVYGMFGSPYVGRVDIALKLKGVEYKTHVEDLSNKSASLLKYNPVHKMVPVLVHNDKPVAESLVILEYIDETWTDFPILPSNPLERAQARFWAKFVDEKCIPALRKALWVNEDRDKNVEEASKLLKIFENELKDKKYFGGGEIGIVDIVANFIAHWLSAAQEVAEVEILSDEKFPKLSQWSHEFVNHSVVKQLLPPKDFLKAYNAKHFKN